MFFPVEEGNWAASNHLLSIDPYSRKGLLTIFSQAFQNHLGVSKNKGTSRSLSEIFLGNFT